ncbi:hypothetical protein HK405_012311, partial [Cladochytrium tenue]
MDAASGPGLFGKASRSSAAASTRLRAATEIFAMDSAGFTPYAAGIIEAHHRPDSARNPPQQARPAFGSGHFASFRRPFANIVPGFASGNVWGRREHHEMTTLEGEFPKARDDAEGSAVGAENADIAQN